ncbi:hypothetical protein ABZT47_32965 [Sphaerisporangium sp. NPDC005289]|uniref:hypothetical protein n=1 Tax=Sphaerisporangium sp. NPDC005289 TaxID=3155247 RepID=UPI0033AED5D6
MGDKQGLDLSAPQIAGSALAAATAAVAASFLGVHGTVIGAALASAGTTVGNAIYTHYIHRTKDRLLEAHSLITGQRESDELAERAEETVVARAGDEGLATAVHATVRDHGPADLPVGAGDPVRLSGRDGEPVRLAGGDGDSHPAGGNDGDSLPPHRKTGRRPLWVTMIAAAVATFGLSMGGIVAFELVSGKPLTATVHGAQGSGTSFGGTVSDREDPSPTPSAPGEESGKAPAGEPSAGGSAKPTTDESGQTGGGSQKPSVEPSDVASPQSTGGDTGGPTADQDTGGQGDFSGGTDGGSGTSGTSGTGTSGTSDGSAVTPR